MGVEEKEGIKELSRWFSEWDSPLSEILIIRHPGGDEGEMGKAGGTGEERREGRN